MTGDGLATCDVMLGGKLLIGLGCYRALMQEIKAGDAIVVVRLDRLARSVSHLLEMIEDLKAQGAHFPALRDLIDTLAPQGMFSLQVSVLLPSWSGR